MVRLATLEKAAAFAAPGTPAVLPGRCLIAGYRIARVQAKRERDEMASMFFSTLAEIHGEVCEMRTEVERLNAIDRAASAEREPWMLLNSTRLFQPN